MAHRVGTRVTTIGVLLSVMMLVGGLDIFTNTNSQSAHLKIQRVFEPLLAQKGSAKVNLPNIGFFSSDYAKSLPLITLTSGDAVQVVVEAISPKAIPTLIKQIQTLGGDVQTTHEALIQATLPVDALTALAQHNSVVFIRQPVRSLFTRQGSSSTETSNRVLSEGFEAIQAPQWHQEALTGKGVKVGVIDTFYRYERFLGIELPEEGAVTAQSFAIHGEMASPRERNAHGVAVSEIIHDIAPDAEMFFTYFETDVEFRQAVNWLIEQDVDVINTSLGFQSGCFNAEGGTFEAEFKRAKDNGITWAAAAGNEATIHWMGAFSDPDKNQLHNYQAEDEGNTLDVSLVPFTNPDGTQVASAIVSGTLAWEAPCGDASDDYEVVVYREGDDGEMHELAPYDGVSGFLSDWLWRPGFPIKVFLAVDDFDSRRAGQTEKYHVAVRKINADAPDARLDMLLFSCQFLCRDMQYSMKPGSVSIQEPVISPSVFTVGATHHAPELCSPNVCPQSPLLFYSGQGPTPFNTLKPDIVAPAHVSTLVFGDWQDGALANFSGFTGTSASAPHAAGAAALVVQAFPDFAPDDVMAFLQNRAEDLGEPGTDNVYGAGLMLLGVAPDRTPPDAPSSLAVSPSGWSNSPTFTVTPTIPEDEQIAAAWHKVGEAPIHDNDGVRTTEIPLTIQVMREGVHPVYVWLEDVEGNVDANNAALTYLRYDATPPSGTAAVDKVAIKGSATAYTLVLNAHDAVSGVASMRFSSNGAIFTDWEPFAKKRVLEIKNGPGFENVYVQFRDQAGNISALIAAF